MTRSGRSQVAAQPLHRHHPHLHLITVSSPHSLLSSVVWTKEYIYRSPVFSFKTQTKINYECYTVYCTLSFKSRGGRGIPAMGCLGAVLEMREAGIYKRKRRAFEVGSGRDCMRLLLMRELCLRRLSSYCCISCRGTVSHGGLQAKTDASPGTGGGWGFTTRRAPPLCCS